MDFKNKENNGDEKNFEDSETTNLENGTQNNEWTNGKSHDIEVDGKANNDGNSATPPYLHEGSQIRYTGNVFLDSAREKQIREANDALVYSKNNKTEEINASEDLETKAERSYATGVISVYDKTVLTNEADSTRDELIRKIEELENQRKSLRQKQLIKEIQALQTEVQSNVQNDTNNSSFGSSGAPVIANSKLYFNFFSKFLLENDGISHLFVILNSYKTKNPNKK